MLDRLMVVVGGQYGSEGKGMVAGALARQTNHAIRVGGPNAGHTVYAPDGRRWALRHVPVAAVLNPDAQLYLGPGSEIDLDVLGDEVAQLDAAGYDVSNRIWVDESATIIQRKYQTHEHQIINTGTTAKGVGAARAARALRQAQLYGPGNAWSADVGYLLSWKAQGTALIEGTQGYALGTHAGYYPYCTSGDCRAIDFVQQAGLGLAPARSVEIYVVLRAHPIRIAGDSGPLYRETSWEQIGVPPEYTTVTHKMRRVGQWDPDLAAVAVHANQGSIEHGIAVRPVITFLDYVFPDLRGVGDAGIPLRHPAWEWIAAREKEMRQALWAVGTSPTTLTRLG